MVYKVKESDLKGQIKDFPIEVVQKMAERQYEQTRKYDMSVFQNNKYAMSKNGGFVWSKSIEGEDFWNKVINLRRFEKFFEKYPQRGHYFYIKRTSKTKINDIIAKLVSLGGKSVYDSYILYGIADIYFIDPINKYIGNCDKSTPMSHFIETFYTEAFVDTIYEYTLDEIAEKLGIDVKQLKIKK